MKKKAKERVIYDNYYVGDEWEAAARENLEERGIAEPSDQEFWDEVNALDEEHWDDVKTELRDFLEDGSSWILFGTIELWRGRYHGAIMFKTLDEMMSKAGKDCDFFRFSDINGHLHLQCSHHDGTNCYEIRKIAEKGVAYYDNWESGVRPNDQRTEWEVYENIIKRYSRLPHFAHQVYGLPKTEFETQEDDVK